LYLIVGTAMRIYLLSAVAVDYPNTGPLFRKLFAWIVVIDLAWVASPLLLFDRWREVILLFVAALAFLPFAQRDLVLTAYARSGGRILRAPSRSRETLNKSLLLMYCESRYHKQRGLDETADVGDGGRV